MTKNNLRQPLLYLGVIFVLVLFTRLHTLSVPIFNVDEAVFAVMGDSIIDGQLIYRDIQDHPAPVTPYFYALVFMLFGKNNMPAIRMALILLIFGICVILFLIGALTGRRNTGYVAALFFGIFSYTYRTSDVLAFEAEWLSLFFCLLGVYFLLKYCLQNKFFLLFISGLFYAAAFFSKQLSLSVYAASLLFCCVFTYYKSRKPLVTFKALFLNLSGFSCIFALIVYYFYINNALRDFSFWFWQYNNLFYVAEIPAAQRIISGLLYFMREGSFFEVNYLLLILFFTNVAAVGLVSFNVFAKHQNPDRKLLIDWYLIFWAVFAYIGAAYSGRHFGHYYIIALAPFCLIGARTVEEILQPSRSLFVSGSHKPAAAGLNKPIIEIFLILSICYGLFAPLRRYAGRICAWKHLGEKDALTNYTAKPLYELITYIKSNSGEREKIFVWGFFPEIYVLTGRMPATPYVQCNFLTGLIPWTNHPAGIDTSYAIVPGAWKIFMEEMNRGKPKFIIDTSVGDINYYAKYPIAKFPALYGFMMKNYKIKGDFFADNATLSFRLWERID